MTNKYLYRLGGTYEKGHRAGSGICHLIRDDGKTSVCGAAVLGEQGYHIIEKTTLLRSMTCRNCRIGRVVKKHA